MNILNKKIVILTEDEIKKLIANAVSEKTGCAATVENVALDISSDGPYESPRLRSASVTCDTGRQKIEI